MRATKEIRFQFENETMRTIQFKNDISTRTLSAVRKILINQCAPSEDPSPANWIFSVNDVVISPLDAANRIVADFPIGSEYRLEFKRLEAIRVVRMPSQKRTRESNTKEYDLMSRLKRIMQENIQAFQSERESNGICHANVMAIMGHISKNIASIDVPIPLNDISFQLYEHNNQPFEWLQTQTAQVLAFTPFFVPSHVSLLCKFGNRILHMDASQSMIPINQRIFNRPENISYTYVNYQMYDDTNEDLNLAGGNCAMFTGLNMIACILRYRHLPVRYPEFWSLFDRVLKNTPDEQAIPMLRNTMRNLLYMYLQVYKDGNGIDTSTCPLPPANITDVTLFIDRSWLLQQDFTSDFLMLTYFKDAQLGFHQVNKLGNAFRIFLREMVQSGFISAQLIQGLFGKA